MSRRGAAGVRQPKIRLPAAGRRGMIGTVGAEPWDMEWAAARSAEALRYLGRNYPECLENLRALDEYEEQAHRAAMRSVIAMDTLRVSQRLLQGR